MSCPKMDYDYDAAVLDGRKVSNISFKSDEVYDDDIKHSTPRVLLDSTDRNEHVSLHYFESIMVTEHICGT